MMPLEALNSGDRSDFSYARTPKCPHCGEDFDIDENEAWFLYDENDRHEVECPSCELDFEISSSASWSFSTDEQD